MLSVLVSLVLLACSAAAFNVSVIDLRSYNATTNSPLMLATFSASGLVNRISGAQVMVFGDDYDPFWLSSLLPNATVEMLQPLDFLATVFATYGAVYYDSSVANGTFLPSVVTLCGVLDAIPIDESLHALFPNTKIVLDTRTLWQTVEDAVQYTADRYLNMTSSLAIQNGIALQSGFLSDFIVSERLFVSYLPDSCVPLTKDNDMLKQIVADSPWARPIRVYGYNLLDVVFGGYLFEAETDCINTLGQIASEYSNNMGFWSRVNPVTTPLTQSPPPQPPTSFNSSKTYVALVYGDMDNLDFVRSFGSDHMRERVALCANDTAACFPFTWTLSPNLLHVAPDMMRWYFAQAATTNSRDFFIMPPSGTLYSYPSMMSNDTQAHYVAQQTIQAELMNTTGSVHWEWFFDWSLAWENYFPRYTTANITEYTTRAFFLNNVPWLFMGLGMDMQNESYRFVGVDDSVVAFRPAFNWMEGSSSGGEPFNSTVIAKQVSELAKGSVHYIYIIQNTPLPSVFDMVSQLEEHVELVTYIDLIHYAKLKKTASEN